MTPGRLAALALLACALSFDLGEHRWPSLEPIRFVGFVALAIVGAIAASRCRTEQQHSGNRLLVASFLWVTAASAVAIDPFGQVVPAAAVLGTYLIGAAVGTCADDPFPVWVAVLVGTFVPLGIGAVVGVPADSTRWVGWSEEPNGLAVVAALALVLSVISGHRHRLAWIVGGLAAITLLATNAAVPAAAALAGVGLWLTRDWPVELRRWGVAVAALVTSAAVLAVYWLPTESLPGDGYNLETLNERTRLWSFSMEAVADAPLLGHGARASHDVMALGAFDDRVHWGPTHSHNAWVEITVAGGWPAGMLFLIGLALSVFVAARRGSHGSLALISTICVLAISEPLIRDPSIAVLVLGVAVTMSERDAAHPS